MTDFTFYNTTYLGGREAVLSATSFPFWERRASQEVRKYTFGNVNETGPIPEAVKLCVCEVAEKLYNLDKQDSQGISSEKVGEHSVSYQNRPEVDKQREIYQIIVSNLANTGYLYAGVN